MVVRCINATHTLMLVAKLSLNVVCRETVLIERGARNMAKAVASLAAFIADSAQCHQEYSVTARFGSVAASGEEQGVRAGDRA